MVVGAEAAGTSEATNTPEDVAKAELLARVVDYLVDKPISVVSFRTLATALDVSTYSLAYTFGSRAQLISEIIETVTERVRHAPSAVSILPTSLEAYFGGIRATWEWSILPEHRYLVRLEMEAALLEALDPTRHHGTRRVYEGWRSIGEQLLIRLGMSADDAAIESRVVVNSLQGQAYDLLVNGDAGAARAVFDRLIAIHLSHLTALLEGPSPA